MTAKYLASLIAGAVIRPGLLTVSEHLLTPATATVGVDDPTVFALFNAPAAASIASARYDDGVTLPGGAYLTAPAVAKPAAEPGKTVVVYRGVCVRRGDGWWTRGPVRRVVSWPLRRLLGRARWR